MIELGWTLIFTHVQSQSALIHYSSILLHLGKLLYWWFYPIIKKFRKQGNLIYSITARFNTEVTKCFKGRRKERGRKRNRGDNASNKGNKCKTCKVKVVELSVLRKMCTDLLSLGLFLLEVRGHSNSFKYRGAWSCNMSKVKFSVKIVEIFWGSWTRLHSSRGVMW